MKPYYDDGQGRVIYHADCRDVLPELKAVDLVIADPPYSFGLASSFQEDKAGGWADLMNAARWYASWLMECSRLTANRSVAAWVFNSWRSYPILARAAYEVSWAIESLLVWDKECIGQGGPHGLRSSYELIALFAQPRFALANRGIADVWRSKWSSQKPSGHPAEKPLALVRRLIIESGGSKILDPFLGSGTTLVAAKTPGLTGIGIEAEERYCEMAANRLLQEAAPLLEAEPCEAQQAMALEED